MGSWFKPTIENAPCPPFFVDNVYEIFINQTLVNNLTEQVVEAIRKKCSIDIPTTTTTSTTTTSTTTTPEPSISENPATTSDAITKLSNNTIATDTKNNVTVTDSTKTTSGSQVQTTTLSYQNRSDINTNVTSSSGPSSSIQTTEFYSNTTTESVNVTSSNITGAPINEPVSSSGCNTVCIIGIGTGAVCLCLLCLLFIALATLFRKGRQSKPRSRSQSRSRFGDMPDVDLYDSVDIGDSPASKRNSGSSLFRRSGDFTRSPPVVFDNPAYRRSFELRPSRYNSWYDPDATDYIYSQNNANLITRKSRNSDRRSVSTSRLNDKNAHAQEHRRHGSSSSWHSSIRDHVPKMLNSSSEGDFSQRSPYLYSSQNRLISNGVNDSPVLRTLPRTPIENKGSKKGPNSKSKHSYRSRSYDPDMSTGSGSIEETKFMSLNNDNSRGQYMKHNQSKKNIARERKDKKSKRKDNRSTDIEIPYDRIYRNNSEYNNSYSPIQHPRNSSYRGTNSQIISSNLQPVLTNYNGVTDNYGRNRSRTDSDRNPDEDDYYAGQGRSFREISSNNSRRYNTRQSSYKPDRNEIYMFQTKL